jgi:transposase
MTERYVVAGIDVHKSRLAVVVAEGKVGEMEFQRRRFGSTPSPLRELAAWLRQQEVAEAVMESTAQYWRPVGLALEGVCELHLAQARSQEARRGRKSDFRDAERLVHRFLADELVLSFVPNEEQPGWRWLPRTRYALVRERSRVQNQSEGLLEDGQIKLSSKITDLFGASGRRILRALAEHSGGPLDTQKLASLADEQVRASREELQDARDGRWLPRHSLLLGMHLDRLQVLDKQIEQLYIEIGQALPGHQDAVSRLSEVPGWGPDAAMQGIAEVGPAAATFPSPEELSSWVGGGPGENVSAGQSTSDQSPKGNCTLRRLLDQAAQAAVKKKGSFFQHLYRRLVPRLGEPKALWAVAHRLCRLVWKILHQGGALRGERLAYLRSEDDEAAATAIGCRVP